MQKQEALNALIYCFSTHHPSEEVIDTPIADQAGKIHYLQIMGEVKFKKELLKKQLQKEGIYYDQHLKSRNFTLRPIKKSHNRTIVALAATLGSFSTTFVVCNTGKQSFIHYAPCLSGNCGQAYFIKDSSQRQFAIKCVPLLLHQSQSDYVPFYKQKVFLRTVHQYFIAKIASALKIGPKITKIQQFDFVFNAECIEFYMQCCDLDIQLVCKPQDRKRIKKSIGMFHALGIVHGDIKTDNIVYSNYFKRPVLIDYGLSQVLKQNIDEKTRTHFIGTLENSCPEMVDLFRTQKQGLVNLYYNDAFAFSRTLVNEPERQTMAPIEAIIQFYDVDSPELCQLPLLFNLYEDRVEQARGFLKPKVNKQIAIKLMLELPATQNLRQFYHLNLYGQWSQSIIYRDLAEVYKCNQSHCMHLKPKTDKQQAKDQKQQAKELQQFYQDILDKDIDMLSLDKYDFQTHIAQDSQCELCLFMPNEETQKQLTVLIQAITLLDSTRDSEEKIIKTIDSFMKKHNILVQSKDTLAMLSTCWNTLQHYCWEQPVTKWKINNLQIVLKHKSMVQQYTYQQFEGYLDRILALKASIAQCLLLIHAVFAAMMHQVSFWNKIPQSNAEIVESVKNYFSSLIEKYPQQQNLLLFYKLVALILFDMYQNRSYLVDLEKLLATLPLSFRNQQKAFVTFFKAFNFYTSNRFELCRQELNKTLQSHHVLSCLSPQLFLLNLTYLRLGNASKYRMLMTFIEKTIKFKDIYNNMSTSEQIKLAILKQHSFPEESLWSTFKRNVVGQAFVVSCLQLFFQGLHLQTQHLQTILKEIEPLVSEELSTNMAKLIENTKQKQLITQNINYELKQLIYAIKPQQNSNQQTNIFRIVISNYYHTHNYRQVISIVQNQYQIASIDITLIDHTVFDLYVKSLYLQNSYQSVSVLVYLTNLLKQKFVHNLQQLDMWMGSFLLSLLAQNLCRSNEWKMLASLLSAIAAYIDTHPTQSNINYFLQTLRLSLHQGSDYSQLLITLDHLNCRQSQWRHSFLALVYAECLSFGKADQSSEKTYKDIVKIVQFFPFLPKQTIHSILQVTLPRLLGATTGQRKQKNILMTARKLVNFVCTFDQDGYKITQVMLQKSKDLSKIILAKHTFINTVKNGYELKLGRLAHETQEISKKTIDNKQVQTLQMENGIQSHRSATRNRIIHQKMCQKLIKYHQNAGNHNNKAINGSQKQLLRLQLPQFQ